jgi:hypothetical protein
MWVLFGASSFITREGKGTSAEHMLRRRFWLDRGAEPYLADADYYICVKIRKNIQMLIES